MLGMNWDLWEDRTGRGQRSHRESLKAHSLIVGVRVKVKQCCVLAC